MAEQIVFDVLNHIRCYRITTAEAVERLFRIEQAGAARALLEHLEAARFIAKAELTPDSDYFYLLPKAKRLIALDEAIARPLPSLAKATAYAKLHYCCLLGTYRPMIPEDKFRTRFASLYHPGPRIAYYTEGQQLGYLRVELKAMKGDPYRVLEYCHRDIHKRISWTGGSSRSFRHLIETGRFHVTVLVPTEGRAERLQQEIDRASERHRLYHERLADIERFGPDAGSSEPAFLAYRRWHRGDKNRKRKPPREAPPMRAVAIPGLLNLVYPKASTATVSSKKPLTPKQQRRRARKAASRRTNEVPADASTSPQALPES